MAAATTNVTIFRATSVPVPYAPWERRDDESPRAYAAFRRYLDLGPERSLDKAGEAAKGPQGGRKRAATGGVQKLCRTYGWVSRAAYDAHLVAEADRARLEERSRLARQDEQRRRQVREEMWTLSRTVIHRATTAFRNVPDPKPGDDIAVFLNFARVMRNLIQSIVIGADLAERACSPMPEELRKASSERQEDSDEESMEPGRAEAARRAALEWSEAESGS